MSDNEFHDSTDCSQAGRTPEINPNRSQDARLLEIVDTAITVQELCAANMRYEFDRQKCEHAVAVLKNLRKRITARSQDDE